MDIRRFIESGILEEYCLGLLSAEDAAFVIELTLLYPEVKHELEKIELAMERLAAEEEVKPDPALRNKILSALIYSDHPLDINNLPMVNKYSNAEDWFDLLKHLIPAEPPKGIFMETIRQDNKIAQMFVVACADVPPETHTDTMESFFILEGECRCTVGEDVVTLGPGGFIEIPLHTLHDVKMLTPRVIAILQHRFIA
jgi:mannose-6-phosphate isomerase-like protein (cupin superfamily)